MTKHLTKGGKTSYLTALAWSRALYGHRGHLGFVTRII